MTSPALAGFKELLKDAKAQRIEVNEGLRDASERQRKLAKERSWRSLPVLRALFRKRLQELEQELAASVEEVEFLSDWRTASMVQVEFDISPQAKQAHSLLVTAFDELRQCHFIWDITGQRPTDKAHERTSASSSVSRQLVRLDYSGAEFIEFAGNALRFPNANHSDLLVFPGFICMERSDGEFDLIDLTEVVLSHSLVSFVEDELVPRDTQVVGHTWLRANKDGSPDRRFANNSQIPICQYGTIRFSSPTGLNEEYQFSNAGCSDRFARVFASYQAALRA